MTKLMMNVLKEEEGQALTEYGLILGLIAVVTVGALTMMGTNVNKMLSSIANTLSATGK
ncbi:Flp family type IVb pilin [bacterium]|nr:Flp family type IVb pilin [bacterium]